MEVTPKTEAQLKQLLADCYFRLSEHPRKNDILRARVRITLRDLGWDPDEVLTEAARQGNGDIKVQREGWHSY